VPDTSIVFGILLAILGLYGFFTTGMEHPTALIPTGVGAVLIVLGALARKETLRKHAMHAAAVVGVLGFLAGAGRFIYELSKGMDVTGTAGMSTATMAVLCGVFVALCVKSFVEARRRRKAGAGVPPSGAPG
jgi:membrane-bound ClpP family serine protease